MKTIKDMHALEILDSRGNPTIETTLILSDGTHITSSVPSGASVSKYEAIELRDHDQNRYFGLGVLQAVANVNRVIRPKLVGLDVIKQGTIDQILLDLDGTPNKSRLGANAILSVSQTVCKGGAYAVSQPIYKYINQLISYSLPVKIEHIPTPIFNVINGGKHGVGNLDFQEFHIVPASIKSFYQALQMGVEIYQKLKQVLAGRNASYATGDEGGFVPNLYTNLDAFEVIMEAIRGTKYRFGSEIFLGLDVAATQLKKEDSYYIKDRPTALPANELIEYFTELHKTYRLLLLEDPIAEDDWADWTTITQRLEKEVHIVADDLIATNFERLKKAIETKACSTIIVKPNQVGTVSETLSVINLAKKSGIKIVLSHRSGETTDTFIADLAVGVGADYVKFGAPARGERVIKYNHLLHIEQQLGLSAKNK